jgi:ATP-binding cassette subfamily B (MDR/TAP) protein 7
MSATYAPRGIYSCHKLARPSFAFSRISTCQQSIRPTIRVFTTSPWRCKDDNRVKPVTQETKVPAAEPTKTPTVKKEIAVDPLLAEQTVSNKEQRKADWAIIKDMAHYLWPKDDFGTRFRVGLSVALLKAGVLMVSKVLNVQVPFYFKSIVDSMNIDFAAVGGTAVTVAGATIFACKTLRHVHSPLFL